MWGNSWSAMRERPGLFTVAKLLFLEKLFLGTFILNYQAAIYKANIDRKNIKQPLGLFIIKISTNLPYT